MLKFMKQSAFLQYMNSVLQPLLQHEKEGCYLRVSRKSNVVKKFVPFVLAFVVDSAEGYYICGTRAGKMKCRMCENITSDFNPNVVPSLRLSKDYKSYQEEGERYMKVLICC